jgi:hypothetical protein
MNLAVVLPHVKKGKAFHAQTKENKTIEGAQ